MRKMRLFAITGAVAIAATLTAVLLYAPRPARVDAAGGPLVFTAILNGGQETPPVTTDYYGAAFFRYDPGTDELCRSINFTIPDGDTTLAHYHFGAAGVGPGPIEIEIGADSPSNGCNVLSAAQLKALTKGQFYVNIHTTAFPGGEIRGQMMLEGK